MGNSADAAFRGADDVALRNYIEASTDEEYEKFIDQADDAMAFLDDFKARFSGNKNDLIEALPSLNEAQKK